MVATKTLFNFADYGREAHTNTQAPQINAATWRFDPSTGATVMVDDTLHEPNGAQLSPDGNTLYLTDTGAGSVVIDPSVSPSPPMKYTTTGKRTVYAFDIERKQGGHVSLKNKSPLHLAMDYAPDGIKVTQEGYIVTASGHGVTVIDPGGTLLLRIQTNFTVINIAWTGRTSEDLWAVGVGGAARIRIGLKGPLPAI